MYIIMEVNFPQSTHTFQRRRIRILRCMNFPGDKIQVEQGRNGVVSKIYAGRCVSEEDIIRRVREHLSSVSASIQVLRMRII